jgi:hypothetical protein
MGPGRKVRDLLYQSCIILVRMHFLGLSQGTVAFNDCPYMLF